MFQLGYFFSEGICAGFMEEAENPTTRLADLGVLHYG